MNDKQKWFIVVAVGCIGALGMAISFQYRLEDVFEVK